MTTKLIIYAIIGLCLMLIITSYSKQFKLFFNFVLRATLGILSFSVANMLFATNGIYIALNLFTLCIAGFLGFYGIIAIVLTNIILWRYI